MPRKKATLGLQHLSKRESQIMKLLYTHGVSTVAQVTNLFPVLIGTLLIGFLANACFANPDQKTTEPNQKKPVTGTDIRGDILTRDGQILASSKALPGQTSLRHYPFGKTAAHLTGFVREKHVSEKAHLTGTSGLEKSLNESLQAGKTVTLTIDSRIQKKAYELLKTHNHPGAIIVSNPANGEILALASWPTFDPNQFLPKITVENWNHLKQNKNQPLFDRSTQGRYPPGSTAKIITALASEYAGLQNPEFLCKSFAQFDRMRIPDWNPNRNELLRIPSALETSCNTYFIELAIASGPRSMHAAGSLLGLGQSNLPELDSRKSSWLQPQQGGPQENRPIDLATASIGIANNQINPIDLNALTSAVATGIWHQPHLLLKPTEPLRQTKLTGNGKITIKGLRVILQGMTAAVQGKRGVTKKAAVPGHLIAGTSATFQYGKNQRGGWFTGYAPAQNPHYTVTIIFENIQSAGKEVAPAASKMFEFLLKK